MPKFWRGIAQLIPRSGGAWFIPFDVGIESLSLASYMQAFSFGYCVVFSVARSCLRAELVSELCLCFPFYAPFSHVPIHVLRLVTAIGALVQSYWQGFAQKNSDGAVPKNITGLCPYK